MKFARKQVVVAFKKAIAWKFHEFCFWPFGVVQYTALDKYVGGLAVVRERGTTLPYLHPPPRHIQTTPSGPVFSFFASLLLLLPLACAPSRYSAPAPPAPGLMNRGIGYHLE